MSDDQVSEEVKERAAKCLYCFERLVIEMTKMQSHLKEMVDANDISPELGLKLAYSYIEAIDDLRGMGLFVSILQQELSIESLPEFVEIKSKYASMMPPDPNAN